MFANYISAKPQIYKVGASLQLQLHTSLGFTGLDLGLKKTSWIGWENLFWLPKYIWKCPKVLFKNTVGDQKCLVHASTRACSFPVQLLVAPFQIVLCDKPSGLSCYYLYPVCQCSSSCLAELACSCCIGQDQPIKHLETWWEIAKFG